MRRSHALHLVLIPLAALIAGCPQGVNLDNLLPTTGDPNSPAGVGGNGDAGVGQGGVPGPNDMILPSTTEGAYEIYMRAVGADGEVAGDVTVPGYEGLIELSAVAYGYTRAETDGTGETRRRGDADFQTVDVAKRIDASSVPLSEEMWNGRLMDEVEIYFVRIDAERPIVFEIKLSNAWVAAVAAGGAAEAGPPTETISFEFERIEQTFHPYDDAGRGGADIEAGWDLEQGRAL